MTRPNTIIWCIIIRTGKTNAVDVEAACSIIGTFFSLIFHVLVELFTFILRNWSTGSRRLDPETDKAHVDISPATISEAKTNHWQQIPFLARSIWSPCKNKDTFKNWAETSKKAFSNDAWRVPKTDLDGYDKKINNLKKFALLPNTATTSGWFSQISHIPKI